MSFFSKLVGGAGDILSNPVGSLTGALGMQNKYRAGSADLNNPFGSDQAARDLASTSMGATNLVAGQQGNLANQFMRNMNTADPRYAQLYGTGLNLGNDPRFGQVFGAGMGLGNDPRFGQLFGAGMGLGNDPRFGQIFQGAMGLTGENLNPMIQQSMDIAAGRGPNPAQQQFQQNINQAIQQQTGTVASVRGLNPAL